MAIQFHGLTLKVAWRGNQCPLWTFWLKHWRNRMTTDTLTQAEQEALEALTIETYDHRVIALFRDGHPTPAHYDAMAAAVRYVSEVGPAHLVACIDRAILREPSE